MKITPVKINVAPRREDFEESETPIAMINSHYLDQISDRGLYKTTPILSESTSTKKTSTPKIKQRLNATVAIGDIMNIDPMGESFCIKFRLYLFWEVNLHAIGLGALAEKALSTGHFYSMTRAEIEELEGKYNIPKLTLFNEKSSEAHDAGDIRIYGGKEGMTALMWNGMFYSTCRERFEMYDFPFDWQDLTLDLRLNDPKTWDDFDLTVNTVQFHKDALQLSEWEVFTPIVQRDSPKEKATKVHIQVKRFDGFYLQNVVAMLFGLSMLGLLSFSIDIEDLGSRTSTILTLILTSVAFKFILSSTLPKVPYNCLIDYFMMAQMGALGMMAFFSIIPKFCSPDVAPVLNKWLALCSCFCIVLSLVGWLVYAQLFVKRKHSRKCLKIVTVPGKNWYSFRYSSPSFLVGVKADK